MLVNNKRPYLQQVSVALMVCSCSLVNAEIKINGFANMTVGAITDKYDDKIRNYDHRVKYDEESSFGLQFTKVMDEKLSSTVQFLSKGRDEGDGKWNPNISWAYVKYNLTLNQNIKIGRIRLPIYPYSDFLDIGYAYHWITPPKTVYDVRIAGGDGLSWNYNSDFFHGSSNLQFMLGRFNGKVNTTTIPGDPAEAADVDARNLFSIAWNVQFDSLSYRLSYTQTKINSPINPLDDLANILSNSGEKEAAENWFLKADSVSNFTNIGIKYNPGNWFVESELALLDMDSSAAGVIKSGFISGGIYVGDLLFHLTWEREYLDPNSKKLVDVIVNPVLKAQAKTVSDQTKQDNRITTLGVRYDFHPSAALKFEYQRQRDMIDHKDSDLVAASVNIAF